MKTLLGILLALSVLILLIYVRPKKARRKIRGYCAIITIAYIVILITFVGFHIEDKCIYTQSIEDLTAKLEKLESKKDTLKSEISDIEKTNNISQTYESTKVQEEELDKIEEEIKELVTERYHRKVLNNMKLGD